MAALSLLQTGKPSISAQRVAVRRAAHQVLDQPPVFEDPLAVTIIGADDNSLLTATKGSYDAESRFIRAFMAVRSRFAEDQLNEAVRRGCSQYVILGAGLDTFAYRNAYSCKQLRVFEVDHPATQQWKMQRLAATGIPIPVNLTYVPVDFECNNLSDCLAKTGFNSQAPTFFSWLGVTPYLTPDAFQSTMRFIGSMPGKSGVVFDYAVTRSALSEMEKSALNILAERLAAIGEPFQLFFDPQSLPNNILQLGFKSVEDLATNEINARYFQGRKDGLQVFGGFAHLLCATV
jgi:methyltransferase (TIGR00027 family)